jgi:Spy/CpxP family protein refolding chaperone
MRAITRISIALLLGILITGAMWAQTTDQDATPSAAPGPQKMMGRQHPRGFERMAEQLNLTDQQKTQLQSFKQSQRQQAQAIRQDTSLTPEQKRDKFKQLRESNHQQMMGILTAEQQQKLQQLRSEHQGMRRGKMGGVGPMARLNLTPDQKSQLDPIFQSTRQQVQAVRNDTSLTAEQKKEKIREIHEGTKSQVNSILTPEQQKQWQEMKMHHGRRGPRQGPPPTAPSGL